MRGPGGDTDRIRHCELSRQLNVDSSGAEAYLADEVPSPAEHRPVHSQRAGVVLAGGNADKTSHGGDDLRGWRIRVGAVAELVMPVVASAGTAAANQERTSMPDSGGSGYRSRPAAGDLTGPPVVT